MKVAARIGERLRREIGRGRRPRWATAGTELPAGGVGRGSEGSVAGHLVARRGGDARLQLFVLLAGCARAAPVVDAAVREGVALDVVLLAEIGADAASNKAAEVHQTRQRAEEEDGDALNSATHGRVKAAKATATVANLDDLAGLDHLVIGADDAARTAASSAACALAATAAEVDLPDVCGDHG